MLVPSAYVNWLVDEHGQVAQAPCASVSSRLSDGVETLPQLNRDMGNRSLQQL